MGRISSSPWNAKLHPPNHTFYSMHMVSVERFEINKKVQLRNLGKHRNKCLKFPSGILYYLNFSGTWVILLKCRVGVVIYTRWDRFGYVSLNGLQAIVKVVILKKPRRNKVNRHEANIGHPLCTKHCAML